MEQKKTLKISFSTFFSILMILVIIVMAFYIYIDKNNSNKEIEKLKTNINTMQNTINSLEKEINSTTSNINDNETVSNTDVSFTDEQVKTALSDFLELHSHANCDLLLENLTKKGKLNYDSSKDTIQNDEKILTNIKFSDYKNAMLNYVSEAEFEKDWYSSLYFSKNNNGYLTKIPGGGGLMVYTIKSITKNNDLSYTAKTSYVTEDHNSFNENFTFRVTSYNGNCVIDSINN